MCVSYTGYLANGGNKGETKGRSIDTRIIAKEELEIRRKEVCLTQGLSSIIITNAIITQMLPGGTNPPTKDQAKIANLTYSLLYGPWKHLNM